MAVINFNHSDIENLITKVYKQIEDKDSLDLIVAIGRGGFIPAVYLSHRFGLKNMSTCFIDTYCSDNKRRKLGMNDVKPSTMPRIGNAKSVLVVDDIVDSGQTLSILNQWFGALYPEIAVQYACLVYKPSATFSDVIYGFEHRGDSWVKFPWEV